ncbi:Ras- protein Rab-2A [Ceratobasidium sp. 428]|nr:Ras- protein Rab-2A [Ceratobasidium sp. 428]
MKDEMDGLNNLRTSRLAQELPMHDPLGATDTQDDSVKPFLSPPSTSCNPPSYSRNPYMAVTYCPTESGRSYTALIPRTTDYDKALESAKAAFERYFPSGSANRFRWFSARVQVSSGSVWADVTPQVFSSMVTDSEVELRLCEEADDKLDVCILPIGHNLSTTESQNYYDIKVITVGSMSVGKSMMHQYFTKKEEQRRDTLPPTLNVVPDITNRLMTAQGELVKATLWDTAGQERFRAMTQSHYRRAHGVLLVYSIIDRRSFNQCTDWLSEIRANVDERMPIMLIGNQIDRSSERAVQTSQGQFFALQHGLLFTEISAVCGTNVDYAFKRLVHGYTTYRSFKYRLVLFIEFVKPVVGSVIRVVKYIFGGIIGMVERVFGGVNRMDECVDRSIVGGLIGIFVSPGVMEPVVGQP